MRLIGRGSILVEKEGEKKRKEKKREKWDEREKRRGEKQQAVDPYWKYASTWRRGKGVFLTLYA